ncbi:Cyclolysin secretion/processing ATP-binding protein CyaB [Seminavis robusta]|uniref:Cyclolysin secretion/processing ATP-binding protein CyaB n=1 Tax=Seminavis robusta TaxID=568900 RepID=A0A9N8EWM2_9STRA|nr:Cyclolysin secretion/processing ATP-binding protein CyaB [Seminavis robusta]|eukprot:Sro1769_g296490.1 Cyclolysin secretion/processing ATP-binding protein CyaB (764) ;mRNA; r:14226-16612
MEAQPSSSSPPPDMTDPVQYSLAPHKEDDDAATEPPSGLALTDDNASTRTTRTDGSTTTQKQEKDSSVDSSPPSLTKIIRMARPEFPALILAVVLMVAAEAIGLVNPIVIARAYDALVDETLTDEEKMAEIHTAMILVMVLHFSGVAAGFVRHSLLGVIGERLVARLRNQLYGAILKQEIAFFDEHKSGELVSRLGSDTTLLQGAISQSMPEFLLGIIKLLVSVTLMFWISAKLAGVTLGCNIIIFLVAVPFGTVIGKLSKAYQDVLGAAQTRSTESLGAMRTVQSFAAEEREQKRYQNKIGDPDSIPWWIPQKTSSNTNNNNNPGDSNDESEGDVDDPNTTTYSVGFYKAVWNSGFFSFVFGFGFGAMYASLWYGFKLVTEDEITLGDLTAFQSYIFQIGFGLAGTSGHLSKVLEALGASGRIFFLMDRVPSIPTPPADGSSEDNNTTNESNDSNKNDDDIEKKASLPTLPDPLLQPESMEGAVTIEDVSFSYPSRPNVPVLEKFSLTVPPNTTAALVGSSGAGKSTVVALLQRFYDVNAGSIKIDGNDIRTLDLAWLRKHIGYVQQEPSLFGLTVRENISYGVSDHEVTQEEIEEVCRKANAHDFICKWPHGYDTLVGERGVKLSGGQKQRIAIARALLVNPRILLLDEATSALDAESEHLVQSAIEKAVVGRTVIIVAHRLSTIQRATQIVVVDNHQIVDVGSHHELLGRCTKYQDLIKRQSLMHRGGNKADLKAELNATDWDRVIQEETSGDDIVEELA